MSLRVAMALLLMTSATARVNASCDVPPGSKTLIPTSQRSDVARIGFEGQGRISKRHFAAILRVTVSPSGDPTKLAWHCGSEAGIVAVALIESVKAMRFVATGLPYEGYVPVRQVVLRLNSTPLDLDNEPGR